MDPIRSKGLDSRIDDMLSTEIAARIARAKTYLALRMAVPAWKKLHAKFAIRHAPKLAPPDGLKADLPTTAKDMQRFHLAHTPPLTRTK